MRPITLFTLLALGTSTAVVVAHGRSHRPRYCTQTSRLLTYSCRSDARSDYWLARANCEDLVDSREKRSCQREAFHSLVDALHGCRDQLAFREELCDELGEEIYDPEIDPENFVEEIDNPYFPLRPGTTAVYEGETEDGPETIVVIVTHQKRDILGVECTVVRDTVTVDGEIVEDTFDYYAQDREGNVWYFGELSFELEGGEISALTGSWESGVDEAKPGIIMKAHPQPGDIYRQELLFKEAEDMARVLSVDESVEIELGAFDDVVQTEEFIPLEPDVLEHKFYAPGIGLVLEVNLESGEEVALAALFEPGEVEQADFSIDFTPAEGTAQMELALEGGGEVYRFQIYGPEGDLEFEAESISPMDAGPEGLNLDSFSAPLEDLLEEWPEGEYLVVAWGLDGQLYSGDGEVSHDLLEPTNITFPEDGADDVPLVGLSVSWESVDGAELYRVEVAEEDGDQSVSFIVNGDETSVAIDPDFLEPGTEYEIDLEVVGENGNVTSSVVFFTTAE